jgi:hypothetical protein
MPYSKLLLMVEMVLLVLMKIIATVIRALITTEEEAERDNDM